MTDLSINFLKTTGTLGVDLRALRKSRGVTLTDLSEKMGRSVGWLSQVERDISSPTINELRQLAKIFNVPLSLFFGSSEAKANEVGRIVRKSARRKIGGGDIGLVEELLSPDLTDDFEVLRSVFRPNAKLENFVTRPTQEVGYVVSGNLNLWIENEIFELGSGDSFRIRGEQFKWANPNNEDAIVIWVIAPPIY
ncbi:MAG: XRE family transcriptional regulator [Amylibacter sp.]|jgi:transcriptional regulator with XRE-family HTH domain|nr:XRE family transcriptional regulator [Amylibacter sp.]